MTKLKAVTRYSEICLPRNTRREIGKQIIQRVGKKNDGQKNVFLSHDPQSTTTAN